MIESDFLHIAHAGSLLMFVQRGIIPPHLADAEDGALVFDFFCRYSGGFCPGIV
jgi:hypothetical protein